MERKVEEASMLINIGNKYSDMLPSKLLTYFMSGHPIIHFKNQENDSCISYLDRYGLNLIVDETDPVEVSAAKLIIFVNENKGRRLSPESVITNFHHNTPDWNAEQIKNVLMGEY